MQPHHDEICGYIDSCQAKVWRFEDRYFRIDKFGIGTDLYCRLDFSAETRQGWALLTTVSRAQGSWYDNGHSA
jgi:hypothetical protein